MPPHALRMPLYTQVRTGLSEEVPFALSNGMHTLRMPPHTLRMPLYICWQVRKDFLEEVSFALSNGMPLHWPSDEECIKKAATSRQRLAG